MLSSVLTVTQVNTFIKSLIEGDGRLNDFFVQGEISNFNQHYKSGHMYFSLKDDKSALKAVMFSSSAMRLKFVPEVGMRVIVRGRISVYEPSGQYQIYAADIQPDGIGALSLAFEQLKQKLEAEGLFDSSLKKALPLYPQNIAVITSKNGAALKDILHITGRRWPMARILLYPVSVQGENAAGELMAALKKADDEQVADVIIIGRGGGSYEDLQEFNNEGLAHMIYASEIPVVSAVGHETDFTIADFVADVKASTPSAAAELVTPDINDEISKVGSYIEYFKLKSKAYIEQQKQRADMLIENSPLASPEEILSQQKQAVLFMEERLAEAAEDMHASRKNRLAMVAGILNSLSPLKTLARGYSYITNESGELVNAIGKVRMGEKISARVSNGRIIAEVTELEEDNER